MGGMFLGGTMGSMGAMLAWQKAGWLGVGYFAIVLAVLAAIVILPKK
jgi:hypothetical protein